jgi:uncharacterized protein YqjF (DUF2071 family)
VIVHVRPPLTVVHALLVAEILLAELPSGVECVVSECAYVVTNAPLALDDTKARRLVEPALGAFGIINVNLTFPF